MKINFYKKLTFFLKLLRLTFFLKLLRISVFYSTFALANEINYAKER